MTAHYTWQDAPAANGPRLVAWIEANHLPVGVNRTQLLGDAVLRAMGRWRAGSNPNFYMVDKMLARLERHPCDLPESLWDDATVPKQHGGAMRREPIRSCPTCDGVIDRLPKERAETYRGRYACTSCLPRGRICVGVVDVPDRRDRVCGREVRAEGHTRCYECRAYIAGGKSSEYRQAVRARE